MEERQKNMYIGYEYKQIVVPSEYSSMYMDCYEAFGWHVDENYPASNDRVSLTTIRLKRDRKLVNKMELTRLQRQFEACALEIQDMERSKHSIASMWALVVGILGTVFMAGATFAATSAQPIWWLCVLLAVPGVAGWLCPWFLYRYKVRTQTRKVQPLIEAKQEEIHDACEKAYSLL